MQLLIGVLPFADGVAEVEEALIVSLYLKHMLNRRTLSMPWGLTLIIMQNPRNAESFSSLSLISHRAVHQACANVPSSGAIIAGATKPSRPMVTAAFSDNDFGDLALRRIGTNRWIRG